MLNIGPTNQVIGWALKGFRRFGKPEAAAILRDAIALARRDKAELAAGGNSLDGFIRYKKRGTFAKRDKLAGDKMFLTGREVVAVVKKWRADFETLA